MLICFETATAATAAAAGLLPPPSPGPGPRDVLETLRFQGESVYRKCLDMVKLHPLFTLVTVPTFTRVNRGSTCAVRQQRQPQLQQEAYYPYLLPGQV